jgi:transcriptional regulator with XRE-family HTH domain
MIVGMAADLHRKWGRAIKSAREAKGWTQTGLADHLNVRPSTVCRWEAGGCAPSDANKLRIAAVLDADVGELFRLVEVA